MAGRARRSLPVAAAAVLVVLVLAAGWALLAGRGEADVGAVDAPQPQDRSGWRWESYGGVEVQVPSTWTYGISDAPWCIAGPGEGRQADDGEVGRPGPVRSILCTGGPPADQRGQHVWLSSADARRDENVRPGTYQLGGGWVRDVVERAGTRVDVQTRDPELRAGILASVREVQADVHRCPADHPISAPRWVRPEHGARWNETVTGVSICRYGQALFGSRRLDGAAAQRVLDAIEAARTGGSDERSAANPASTLAGGTVLRFDTAGGVREVFVRYDFGQYHGFDNGDAVRRLTRSALTFMSGPLVVNAGPGSTVELLPRR